MRGPVSVPLRMSVPPSSPGADRQDPLPAEDWFQRLSRFHQDNQDHGWFSGSLDPIQDDSRRAPEEHVSWRVFGRRKGQRPPLKSLKPSNCTAVARVEPVVAATATETSLLSSTASLTTVGSSWTRPSSSGSVSVLGGAPALPSSPLKVGKGRGARRQEIRAQIQASQEIPRIIRAAQENTDPNPPPGPMSGDSRPTPSGLESCAALFSSDLPADTLPALTPSYKQVTVGRGHGNSKKY